MLNDIPLRNDRQLRWAWLRAALAELFWFVCALANPAVAIQRGAGFWGWVCAVATALLGAMFAASAMQRRRQITLTRLSRQEQSWNWPTTTSDN